MQLLCAIFPTVWQKRILWLNNNSKKDLLSTCNLKPQFYCRAKEKVEMAGTCPTDDSRLSAKGCFAMDTPKRAQR